MPRLTRLLCALALCTGVACSRKPEEKPAGAKAPAPAAAAAKPSLGERLTAAIHARSAATRVIAKDDKTLIVVPPGKKDDEGLELSLDNLTIQCEQDPDTCQVGIDRYADLVLRTALTTEEVDPELVRAVIKDRATVDNIIAGQRARKQGEPAEMLSRPLVADLVVVYVEDAPTSLRFLNDTDLKALGLDLDQLHALALKNLAAALPTIPHTKIDEMPNLWMVTAGDSYDAARLLLIDRWKEIADEVDGDLVVAAPTRDMVLITGTATPDTIKGVRALAAEASQKEAYTLSNVLLRWTPAGWVEYRP